MALRTTLYQEHLRLGARMVGFGGWDMPLHYGSQIEEHHAVRRDAGMFDVSHMRPIDISGPGALTFLRRLLANDAARLTQVGKALYSCLLNPSGGVIDDLILYRLGPDAYRLVVNAATADKDLAWMLQQAESWARHAAPSQPTGQTRLLVAGDPVVQAQGADDERAPIVRIARRDDLAIIAVQGPRARALSTPLLPGPEREPLLELAPFSARETGNWMVSRTGYTGEDGFEIILPVQQAPGLWQGLLHAGVKPCGLGARDTLRLEAGMNLYGQDMDELPEHGPLDSGLGWTIAWEPEERDFIGRAALAERLCHPERHAFVGVILAGRGILRPHQTLHVGDERVGELTSGGFAPTLGTSVGLARIRHPVPSACQVQIRGKEVPARIIKPPFVRHGKILVPAG